MGMPQVPGVQDGIPLFRSYGWHTYNWANYGPVYAAGAFTSVSIDQINPTTVRVNFTPQFSGSALVMYGMDRGTSGRSVSAMQVTAATPTSIILRDLNPGTTYTTMIVQEATLTDQTGANLIQTGYSDQYVFVTSGSGSPVAPIIASVVVTSSGPAANRTATITWRTNVPCLNKVNYGPLVSYGSVRNDTTTPPGQTGAYVTLPKLTGGNQYHYQCQSQGRDYQHSLLATTTDATFTA
jgi:hypothetical protein